jgi:glucose/mannose-6-phosphate isomerase
LTVPPPPIDVTFDRKGLLRDYRSWPETGLKTLENMPKVEAEPTSGRVFVAGMGASSAAGEFLRDALAPAGFQVNVIRSHLVPSSLSKDDFIVGMSLSGGTEETGYVFDKALRKGCKGVAVATGGMLRTIAEKRGAGFIRIEGGATARSSFPIFVSTLAAVLDAVSPGLAVRPNLQSGFESLRPHSAPYCDPDTELSPPARTARWLEGSMHVRAYNSPFNPSVANRFKNVLSENAKVDCSTTDIMDVMHDGITCWENDYLSRLLLLRSWKDDEVVKHRFALIGEQVRSLGFGVEEVTSGNEAPFADLLHSFYYLDLVSVFWALIRRLDPGVTQSQEVLKQKLSGISTLKQYLKSEYS